MQRVLIATSAGLDTAQRNWLCALARKIRTDNVGAEVVTKVYLDGGFPVDGLVIDMTHADFSIFADLVANLRTNMRKERKISIAVIMGRDIPTMHLMNALVQCYLCEETMGACIFYSNSSQETIISWLRTHMENLEPAGT